jgi:hypothetical protein
LTYNAEIFIDQLTIYNVVYVDQREVIRILKKDTGFLARATGCILIHKGGSKVKFFKISMVSLLIVGVFSSGAWAAETGWNKIREAEGIVSYTRPTPKSSVDEMKGVGVVDASVAVIEALIRDVPAQTEYMYKCKEASVVNVPDLKASADSLYVYNVTSMPFPVNDRDAIAKADFTIDKATGTVYVHVENVKSTYKMDSKKVRMPLVDVHYILVPKGPDKTEVTYVALADPGGNLPAFVINLLTKNISFQTLTGIRKMVQKDKYKDAKTILTTTPN